MSCRTTPAGSAFTSYARLANSSQLSDVATLSTFHYLRSLHQSRSDDARRTYTAEDYRNLLQRQLDRTRRLTQIPEARRNSIITRLEQALQSDTVPDQSTLYALFNLNPTVRDRGRGLQTFLAEYARATSSTPADARSRWDELENSIDRSRNAAAPSTFTDANKEIAKEKNLPRDPGSVHAMATMLAEMHSYQIQRLTNAEQRITRAPASISSPRGYIITEHGFDPRIGRLELVVTDAEGAEHLWSYQNVDPEEYARQEGAGTFAEWWENHIHGNVQHSYESDLAAAEAGVAPRCPVCGQFANSAHACPVLPEPTIFSSYAGRWTRQQVELSAEPDENGYAPVADNQMSFSLPGAMRLREAFTQGPVKIPLHSWISNYLVNQETGDRRWENARLSGSIMAYRTEEGQIAFNTADLTCSCQQFQNTQNCVHIDASALALHRRLVPPTRTPSRRLTPEERAERIAEAQRIADQAALSDWTRNEVTLAEARRTWRSDAEVLYSESEDDFVEVFTRASETARTADTPAISYQRENALGGMAQRGSGQAFGVELEYDFPREMSWTERRIANERIGRELFETGLASAPGQLGYGAARRHGFRDTHTDASGASTWSFERDGSVGGGELVTPAMYDEPETWEKVDKAVEILRRNGAVTSRKAGAHVHVGTAGYNGDGKKYTELARLMTQHEDVMLRIAADPNRGTHRNNTYTSPLSSVPVDGFNDVQQAKRWQGGRGRALNLGGVSAEADHSKDHVEFRIFDATLNPGAIQAQIRTAVAMTNAAARIAGDTPTKRDKELAGSHAQRASVRGRRRLTREDILEDTATFRSLLDTLFSRKQDKDQLIEVFAHTKWTKKRT